jgi:cellulose synthase/poly-beta-1,6-N-acetylglucosamine synthase-like glycosyltransferase
MKILTEEELEQAVIKHTRRRKTFMEEGLSEDEAWDLAEKLFERDQDSSDDRRLCFECKKYNILNKTCPKIVDKQGVPQRPLRFILQRCEWFELKGKK